MAADYMDDFTFMADDDDLDNFDNSKRYTIIYEGYLFEGDSKGLNIHYYAELIDALEIYYHYGNMIVIKDNYYGVTFKNGEWC